MLLILLLSLQKETHFVRKALLIGCEGVTWEEEHESLAHPVAGLFDRGKDYQVDGRPMDEVFLMSQMRLFPKGPK